MAKAKQKEQNEKIDNVEQTDKTSKAESNGTGTKRKKTIGRPNTSKQKRLDEAKAMVEAVEKGLVKKDKRTPPVTQANRNMVAPGDNAKYVHFCLEVAKLGFDCDTKDVNDMREHFFRYLELAFQNDMKVGNIQAYAAMGISHKLASIMEHDRTKYSKEYGELITQVRNICGMYREQMMSEAKLNPIVGIFWQRNYDKLTNNDEPERINDDDLGNRKTAEEIAKEYDLIDE